MSFESDIEKFRKNLENRASKIARKVAIDLHSRIVERTPVDTGRLRANNHLTIGGPAISATLSTGKPSADAVSSYKLGDEIWITNNVEYAYPIEFLGTSRKAPSGFFRISVQDIINAWPDIVSKIK